jgi:hypothetical protein
VNEDASPQIIYVPEYVYVPVETPQYQSPPAITAIEPPALLPLVEIPPLSALDHPESQAPKVYHDANLSGVMSASDLANTHYQTLPFTGRWASFIGQPAPNFDMMISGAPGSGKSTFLIQFAQYLAGNFGNVIYISSEEYGSAPLKEKVTRLHADSPRLAFAGKLSSIDPQVYDFFIFDSINHMKMNIDTYRKFREQYPQKVAILLLQNTKAGSFKGVNDWPHEVEIVCRAERGKVYVEKNRYGVLGSMNIF